MSKTISKFQFKRFAVSHHRSSMKVGIDGVLIGCWADIKDAKRILDVGTGCGLIALIMAQRASEASIDAIDVDAPSIEEALDNIMASPWSDRVNAELCNYSNVSSLLKGEEDSYDLIVSNPPYFNSGVTETITAREKARHQGELSPFSLLCGAKRLLKNGGSVAMVIPTEISLYIEEQAATLGFSLTRRCLVRGHEGVPYKRSLLQWRFNTCFQGASYVDTEYLTLESTPNNPTDAYRALCKDFYLKF